MPKLNKAYVLQMAARHGAMSGETKCVAGVNSNRHVVLSYYRVVNGENKGTVHPGYVIYIPRKTAAGGAPMTDAVRRDRSENMAVKFNRWIEEAQDGEKD